MNALDNPRAQAVLGNAFARIESGWRSLLPLAAFWTAVSTIFSFAEAGGFREAFEIPIMLIALIAMLVLGWKLTRTLANATAEEHGDVVAWFV